MGLSLIAAQDKGKMMKKLTTEASSAINAYCEAFEIQSCESSTTGVNAVSQTLYVQILFSGCAEP